MIIRLSKNSLLLLYLSACFAALFALLLLLDHFHILDPISKLLDWWGTKVLYYLWLAYILISIFINRRKRKAASINELQVVAETKSKRITVGKLTVEVIEVQVDLTIGRRILLISVLSGWGVFVFWVMSLWKSLYVLPVVLLLITLSLSLIVNYFDIKWKRQNEAGV